MKTWLGVVVSSHNGPCEDCGSPRPLVTLRMYARAREGLERADVVVEPGTEVHECVRRRWLRRLDARDRSRSEDTHEGRER